MAALPQVFLKSAPGRIVRDPYTLKKLADDGEWKPRTTYWERRLFFGDCIVWDAPAGLSSIPSSITPVIDNPQPEYSPKRARKDRDNE
jgi:hypothetical protein